MGSALPRTLSSLQCASFLCFLLNVSFLQERAFANEYSYSYEEEGENEEEENSDGSELSNSTDAYSDCFVLDPCDYEIAGQGEIGF